MNRYGQLAKRHWQQVDPERYSTIPDPEDFFSTLGEEVENRVQELQDQLAGPDPPSESYLEKVGRLNMARLQAEEVVLSEMVLIPSRSEPEPEEEGLDLVTDVRAAIDRARQESESPES
jgi:hypothetical protein